MLTSSMTPPPFSSLDTQTAEIVARYPVSKRSAALMVLHLLQETYGFISNEAIAWAAQKLDLQPINLLELVTFYPMFRQKPVGRYHVKVCRTLSCALGGAGKLTAFIKQKLGIEPGQTTPDGRYTLTEVECLASCGTAPMMQVNDDYYENLSEQRVTEILESLK